jgi:hypothetical protein
MKRHLEATLPFIRKSPPLLLERGPGGEVESGMFADHHQQYPKHLSKP